MSMPYFLPAEGPAKEYRRIADDHLQHDLQPSDRDALKSAARRMALCVQVGTVAGTGLALLAAYRVRGARKAFYQAFRARERPTHVILKDGETHPIPDITSLLKPTAIGDIATYMFAAFGGFFLGGSLGSLGSSMSETRTFTADPERMERFEKAFRGFRADMLRKEADAIEQGQRLS
ncbi:hypothetical protein BDW59DRAFT_147743 [Aspergillus cavernicola]|uniref:Uncharacterized protein n=1 Tax=Aspergillus cavernicola TaxID=176166 RepID=A0ABR4I927_9EURO